MTINQLLNNLTLIVLMALFFVIFRRFLITKKRDINLILDALLIIATSGWAIELMSYSSLHANMPALILLSVVLYKALKGKK